MGKPIISKRAAMTLISRDFLRTATGILCLFALGCGGGDDDDAAGSSAKAGTGGPSSASGGSSAATGGSSKQTGGSGASTGSGDASVLVGSFNVKLVAATANGDAYTSVMGIVSDGPSPEGIKWNEGSSSGDCKLYVPETFSCTPACGDSALCVGPDNKCQSYATATSVGTVTIKGLKTVAGKNDLTIEPNKKNNYLTAEALQYPAFAEGDEISINAAGSGSVAAFTLTTKGISPLEFANDTINLDGKDVILKWNKPSQNDASKIYVKLDISHHGGPKGKIECNTKDTGELTLAGSLITALVDKGVAGFPTIVVRRTSTASATIPYGRVDLVISSEAEKAVTVPGLTSCNENTACPTGQTCQKNLSCK